MTEPARALAKPSLEHPHRRHRRGKHATAPTFARRPTWASWASDLSSTSAAGEQPILAMEASSELLMYRPSLSQQLSRSSSRVALPALSEAAGSPRSQEKPPAADAPGAFVKPKLTAGTLTVVALLNLVDCINMNLLTPYAAEMVGELLGQDPTSPSVLRNVGYLIGFYNISEMIFSPFWGRLSDRFGRRPIILASLGGAALVPIPFGMSQSLGMALAVRAFNGVLCGSLGITKTYVAELVEKDKEARAFSIITTCYSVGMMIGPALGGMLQSPAKWSPAAERFFDHGALRIFKTNPYLLPNLVFSIFACFVWLLVLLFLKESLPYEERQARRATLEAAKAQKLEEQRAARAEEGGPAEAEGRAGRRPAWLSRDVLLSQLPFLAYPWSVLRASASYGLCVGYVIATIQNIILLYQIPVADRGFGLSPETLGMLQNCAAAGLLVTQLILYPRLVHLKGYRWCIIMGLSTVLVVTLPMPVYGLLYDPQRFGGVRFVPLVLMMVIQQAAFGFCTPTTMVWINRFAEGLDRGEVNGWANSFAALCRALAPMLVGNLQSAGASMHWDGGRYLALYAISLLAVVVGFLLVPVLPSSPAAAPKAAEADPNDAEESEEEESSQGDDQELASTPKRTPDRS